MAEEVYGRYYDTAGNFHWTGVASGTHVLTMPEAVQNVLNRPPKKYDTKEEAMELLINLGVLDKDGNIREPFTEIFCRSTHE